MIKIGILGYGNLGRGVEAAIKKNDDIELVAVYTRRDPASLKINTEGVAVKSTAELETGKEDIDVLIICGGSATDLPEMTPKYAALYNVIDSFDTHAKVPQHFANVDAAAKSAGKIGIISCGWDPGMFSISRVYAHAVLPDGKDYTFWGKGVSQGQSRAHHPRKAHQRMLCRRGGGRRFGKNRKRNQNHAQLFCRLRHHRNVHISRRDEG